MVSHIYKPYIRIVLVSHPTASCLLPPSSPQPILSLSTMYPYKLALLVLGATAVYGYPATSKNSETLVLVVPQNAPRTIHDPRATTLRVKADERKRQIHNADYQANSPPPSPNPAPAQEASSPSPADPPAAAPSETVAKDKRAEPLLKHSPGPIVSSPSSSHEKTGKDQLNVEESNVKRQVHNADYQANSPPPSPNPAPAQESSTPSPSVATSSDPAPKDRRAQPAFMHSPEPIVVPSPSRSREKTGKDIEESSVKRQVHNADYQANFPPPSPNPALAQESSAPSPPPASASPDSAPKDKRAESRLDQGAISPPSSTDQLNGEKSNVALRKRSMADPADASRGHVNHTSEFVSRITQRNDKWYGLRRRDVEELTNFNNRNFDHDAITRWSRAEVDKMQAWSKREQANVVV
ncbi:hypothetical protein B0H19DRAFT_1366986 [Mycena capillaripes]|nr:hypothetical protein B0H19DRAFT_1366986 [Mycena capillaripes]